MVGIAQLVEHLVVVQGAAGSSPVTHPKKKKAWKPRSFSFETAGNLSSSRPSREQETKKPAKPIAGLLVFEPLAVGLLDQEFTNASRIRRTLHRLHDGTDYGTGGLHATLANSVEHIRLRCQRGVDCGD